jgi:hypothetical protein
MKKLLLTNGCSLTEGAELGNAQFGYDEKKNDPNTGIRLKHLMSQEHWDHLTTHCWPALVASKIGYDLENLGYGGSSNRRIARLTMERVEAHLKAGMDPKDIFVFIGFTDMSRFEVRMDHTDFRQFVLRFLPKDITLSKRDQIIIRGQEEKAEIIYEMITNHHLEVLSLKHYLESRGVDYMFTYGLLQDLQHEYGDGVRNELFNYYDLRLYTELLEYLNGDKWFLPHIEERHKEDTIDLVMTLYLSSFHFLNSYKFHCKCGTNLHPLEEAHEKYAEMITDYLIAKGKVK